jgi:AraC-like DNA-binding protein
MRTAMNDDALHTAPPLSGLLLPEQPTLAPGIVHSDFSVQGDARKSFLAWQERMSPVYDIRPPCKQAEDTFNASLSRYTIDNLSLIDFLTAPNLAVRSLGRVSTESVRDVTFSVFLEGPPSQFLGNKPRTEAQHNPRVPSILALDMDQPCTIRSFEGRLLLLFVPRALVERFFPDAASLHGRCIHAATPLTRLLIEHVIALRRQIVGLSKEEAHQSFLTAVELILAAVYGKVRRHVEMHLRDPGLSPESVLASLHFSRASVYRLFEHEGGLAAYIRNRRLRMAADELVRLPHRGIQDVASGLGFNDASSFTRAFRRAFDIAPRELHEYAPLLRRDHTLQARFT